jgi:hypothetical protein
MPFVEILYGTHVDEATVVAVRDCLHQTVGPVFEEFDPDHVVTPAMVDIRCIEVGDLDVVRPDVLVTVLAREEPARHAKRYEIAGRLTVLACELAPDLDVMLEVVLTNRTSTYNYC